MSVEQHPRALWCALFVVTAAALAVPFLLVQEPPLLDYPNHLARTFVLSHLQDPAYHFAGYYGADWKPYPYVLWDLLMVGLQHWMPVEAAGKLLLILTTIFVPFALAWFLWQVNRQQIQLAFLGCMLAFHTLFLWGFTAYHLSVGFCFLMLGCWFWYRRRPSWWRAAIFFAVVLLTYLAHLLGFASAAFVLTLYALVDWASERNWAKFREGLLLAVFLLPPSVLFLWARPGLGPQPEHTRLVFRDPWEKIQVLFAIPTAGYDVTMDRIFRWGLVGVLLIAVAFHREWKLNRRWAIVVAAFLVVYLLLPYGWGVSSDLDVRLVPVLWLLLPAVLHVGRRARWVALAAVLLTVLRVVNIAQGFAWETTRNSAMNEGIAKIERNARLMPVVDTCKDEDPMDYYYVHYWAYAVIRRGAVSPYLFDIPGQTPMRILQKPYMGDGYWEHCYDSGEPDWQRAAAGIDYVWSYGDQRFEHGLGASGSKVYAQTPLVLWRLRR